MLGKIGCRLPRVPFELHQSSLARPRCPAETRASGRTQGYTHKRPLEPEDDCLYTVEVRFEWDPRKAAANLRTHGVSVAEAVTLLRGRFRLDREDGGAVDEERFIM